jgi:hypothetical protein
MTPMSDRLSFMSCSTFCVAKVGPSSSSIQVKHSRGARLIDGLVQCHG